MIRKLIPEDLPAGTQLGLYSVVNRIALGGHSAVYKAELDKRLFAIKVSKYRPGQRGSESWRLDQRFRQEIAILAQLRNVPGVTHVHAHDCHPEGFMFYVQDHIDGGENILDWAKRQAPSYATIAEVLCHIGQALAEIHRRDIIHRDLKPSNILVSPSNQPVIIDFGLATCRNPEDLTPPNSIPGTVAHMDPERSEWLLGYPKHKPSQRKQLLQAPLKQFYRPTLDIYALGVISYELLTGRHPFELRRKQEAILHDIAFTTPRRPRERNPNIPTEFDALVMHLLEKDPAKRCQSGDELVTALKPIIATPSHAWKASVRVPAKVPAVEESPERPASTPTGASAWTHARELFSTMRHGLRDAMLAGILIVTSLHFFAARSEHREAAPQPDATVSAPAPTGDEMPTTPKANWARPVTGSCDHLCPKDGPNMREKCALALRDACWKVGKPIQGNACDKGWFRAPPEAPSVYKNDCFKPVEASNPNAVDNQPSWQAPSHSAPSH